MSPVIGKKAPLGSTTLGQNKPASSFPSGIRPTGDTFWCVQLEGQNKVWSQSLTVWVWTKFWYHGISWIFKAIGNTVNLARALACLAKFMILKGRDSHLEFNDWHDLSKMRPCCFYPNGCWYSLPSRPSSRLVKNLWHWILNPTGTSAFSWAIKVGTLRVGHQQQVRGGEIVFPIWSNLQIEQIWSNIQNVYIYISVWEIQRSRKILRKLVIFDHCSLPSSFCLASTAQLQLQQHLPAALHCIGLSMSGMETSIQSIWHW